MRVALLTMPLLLLGQVGPPLPVKYLTETNSFSWDPVTTDVTGAPETVAAYELAALAVGEDMNADLPPVPRARRETAATGYLGFGAQALIQGLSPGPYRFQVRARDLAGNWGAWSVPLDLVLDNMLPASPKALRVKVTVTVISPGTP